MQSTEELYKDVVEMWKFIRNRQMPRTNDEWEKLVEEVRQLNKNDDTKLIFHLSIGFMNYLAKMEELKNETRKGI